jgi:hypothetical protein
MKRLRTAAACALLGLTTSGCGDNPSEVPPDLLEAIRATESTAGTGTETGDVVDDFCFDGWLDPTAADFDLEKVAPICIEDFRDPEGASGELLLVNAAAIWCTACKTEYRGSRDKPSLGEHLAERYDGGFRVLGTLFQDTDGHPATQQDAVFWAQQFDVDFPFAIDPTFQLGAFTCPSNAPFNLLLDLRSGEIVLKLEGDQAAVLFAEVDSFLADRAAGDR